MHSNLPGLTACCTAHSAPYALKSTRTYRLFHSTLRSYCTQIHQNLPLVLQHIPLLMHSNPPGLTACSTTHSAPNALKCTRTYRLFYSTLRSLCTQIHQDLPLVLQHTPLSMHSNPPELTACSTAHSALNALKSTRTYRLFYSTLRSQCTQIHQSLPLVLQQTPLLMHSNPLGQLFSAPPT